MKKHKPINIGISACLTGEPVRYDGGHAYISALCEYMSSLFTLVPICPEIAIGLGVPRVPIQLVGEPDTACALGVQSPLIDVTAKIADYAKCTLQSMPDLDGFVVKARSPSCGLEMTPVFNNRNIRTGTGSGIFTRTLRDTHPIMPIIDESCINNLARLDNFILHICVYSIFRQWVLEAEDQQVALNLFHSNLSNALGIQMTASQDTFEQISESCVTEKQLMQYARQLFGQLSGRILPEILPKKVTGIPAAHFDSKRVINFMDKLKDG